MKARVFSRNDVAIASSVNLSSAASDMIARRRIQYGNYVEATVGIFMDYCKNSTVHGLRYLGERKRPYLERVFWIGFFIASIGTCSYLIMRVWDKWNENPVILSFAKRLVSLADIPFPAIVLCPETKAHVRVFNFSKVYFELRDDKETINNLNESELAYLEAFLHVCDAEIASLLNINDLNTSKHIEDTLQELAPNLNDSTPWCKFNGVISWCENVLVPVLADDGMCYQFNGLKSEYFLRDPSSSNESSEAPEWTVEEGYKDPLKTDVYPHRVYASGSPGGFFFTPKAFEYDLEYLCRGSVPGFRVYLQSPGDVPQAPKRYIKVPFMEEVVITLKPNYITTSDTLRKYTPERRQCYFSDERHLKFFKIYTQNNCNFECLINYTISKCGCVKYTMPKPEGVRICGISDINCYTHAEDGMMLREFKEALNVLKETKNKYWSTECNCIPACTSLDYDFEISRAHFNASKLLEAFMDDYLLENPKFLMSRVSIMFKERLFTAVRRSELYGTPQFLANCGGLLALFIGISTLSIVELIYFCTVRLTSNLKMRRKERKSDFARMILSEEYEADPKRGQKL